MSVKMVAKITSYNEGLLCGTLDSIYFEKPHEFSCMLDMIEIMETVYDMLGFPDKSLLPRTFGNAKERIKRLELDLEKLPEARRPARQTDALAVFEIYVNFRHNAEWQGKLRRTDKDETKEFMSVVDLAKLIDESLTD